MAQPFTTATLICNVRTSSIFQITQAQTKSDSAGLAGLMKINGPRSMNYDEDLGPVLLSDWYHTNPFALFEIALLGVDPNTDSTLLQGQGMYCENQTCTGSYYEISFQQGTTYKLSVVNGGSSSQFTFWMDGHNFTVVGMDFVPIAPYVTDYLNINIGNSISMLNSENF
jgi:FtsP/CotA-like multicopper oxidase with cupredoxin domain